MHSHNESDRLRTPLDEPSPIYTQGIYAPKVSAETREWIFRRFPGGINISASVENLLNNPENRIVRDEKRYPRWFRNK